MVATRNAAADREGRAASASRAMGGSVEARVHRARIYERQKVEFDVQNADVAIACLARIIETQFGRSNKGGVHSSIVHEPPQTSVLNNGAPLAGNPR